MTGKLLKIFRIVLQCFLFAVIMAAYVSPSLAVPVLAPLLQKIQIIPALVGLSLFTFVVWLIITLLFGRIYCSTICPLGTLQDIFARTNRLSAPLAVPSRRYRYTKPLPRLRYLFLVIMLTALMIQNAFCIALLDPDTEFAVICSNLISPLLKPFGLSEPPALLPALPGFILGVTVSLTLLFLSRKNGRTVCNTICPVGTALGLVSRYAVFQIDIDTDKCINCGLCADVCKGQCIKLPDHVVDGSRCVTCFSCLPVCPNDAIHFTTRRKQLSIPMLQALTPRFTQEKSTALGLTKQIKK